MLSVRPRRRPRPPWGSWCTRSPERMSRDLRVSRMSSLRFLVRPELKTKAARGRSVRLWSRVSLEYRLDAGEGAGSRVRMVPGPRSGLPVVGDRRLVSRYGGVSSRNGPSAREPTWPAVRTGGNGPGTRKICFTKEGGPLAPGQAVRRQPGSAGRPGPGLTATREVCGCGPLGFDRVCRGAEQGSTA